MNDLISEEQKARYEEFKEYVAANVEQHAGEWDRTLLIPDSTVELLGKTGYLGATIPVEYGGRGWNSVTFGLLNEAIGRACCALAGVLTIQSMVSMALLKWGTEEQRRRWIPPLARGEFVGAFALTEPGAGSDLQSLKTQLQPDGETGDWILNGQKRWISFGQSAAVFLVFGRVGEKAVACLVPRDSEGLEIEPIDHLMGFRTARLAQLTFRDVRVPAANVVGKPGFGLTYVAPVGLHYGRMSTACSALGLLRGCLEESARRAAERKIGEQTVGDLGMVQTLIARMGTDLQAASLLCWDACRADDEHSPSVFTKIFAAKYFTSRAAVRAASDAVQIHGASGCQESSPVARFYRDSKVMEIIEGTTQIHEFILGKHFVREAARKRKAKTRTSHSAGACVVL